MIAALFVEADGPYSRLDECDLWDVVRDARKYRGPHPVVAHPPCERWGRYARGGPSAREKRIPGDDEDCFAAALRAVRHYGGVLEHPAHSKAYSWFGLITPDPDGGWSEEDAWGGRACHVEQGHYGHPARKGTWLYSVGAPLPDLKWGPSPKARRADEGFHSKEEREAARANGQQPIPRLSKQELLHTPDEFRDVLVAIAREVNVGSLKR